MKHKQASIRQDKILLLGAYAYGTLISSPQSRATRLAVFDGAESLASLTGIILSPIIMNKFGRYTSYGLRCGCTFLSIAYAIICLKKPQLNNVDVCSADTYSADTYKITQNNHSLTMKEKIISFPTEFIFKPFMDMIKTVFKRRPHGLHILVALQFYLYGSYSFTWPERQIRYLYMLKTFEGFDGADYSKFLAFTCSGCQDYLLHI